MLRVPTVFRVSSLSPHTFSMFLIFMEVTTATADLLTQNIPEQLQSETCGTADTSAKARTLRMALIMFILEH